LETRVWLRTLRLENFRNFPGLAIDLEPGLNFFSGANGAGKTSILEAVSCLAVARSLRGSSDAEIVRWGEAGFGVGGDCVDGEASRRIVLRYSRGGGKEAILDGEPLAKLSDIVGVMRVAWFSPEDTWLTKGRPGARRRLIDMALCQIDPAYLAALSGYRRALRQRNEALAAWTPDEESEGVVDVWTERLVEYGTAVIAARLAFVPRFNEAVSASQKTIASHDSLRVGYKSSIAAGVDSESASDASSTGELSSADEQTVAQWFRESLRLNRVDERRRGFTLVGPHRDDIEVRLNGRLLRSFGSQGQHRTAAIALKLGEAMLLDGEGRGVVVLLDDVLSELDEERAGSLMGLVADLGQALVTSARAVPERVFGTGYTSFSVDGGEVVRV
jgi:DNA replication and repair protein RecF